jgi:hypothetical protein
VHSEKNNWQKWHQFFSSRSNRQFPELKSPEDYSSVPSSVAKSLAIFQLGESGGGTVIEQARRSTIPGIDGHYADAMQLFVAEEHRHAGILAICVRNLGGTPIRSNWTARLFVFARRLIGLRLKVLVLLAAEVVGICYYHLIATRLPQSRLKSLLAEIVNDERAHLHFHCDFLRTQTDGAWRRMLFVLIWRITMAAAAIVVLVDHRVTLRDLNLQFRTVWRRWMTYSRQAERLVTQRHFSKQDFHTQKTTEFDGSSWVVAASPD